MQIGGFDYEEDDVMVKLDMGDSINVKEHQLEKVGNSDNNTH